MSLLAQLARQLDRFDDDAYAALANRGLLRRAQKDLEKQAVTLIEDTAVAVVVGFGDQRIRFDARGPAQASCSCPAAGVCQHILAAAIGLQRLAAAPVVATASEGEPSAEVPAITTGVEVEAPDEPAVMLHAAILDFGVAALQQHAGKAGYRWAWQYVQDLDAEQGLKLGGDRNIVIGFTSPRMTFRYMGGPVESLVVDPIVSQVAKYRVAAVLAYQRAHGAAITPPESTAKPQTRTLDFGKDHAGRSDGDAQPESRARLRASLAQLLQESIELGLSHLSRSMQERYATLAVWAQGAEYHRLALMLRRITDHVELLLERAGSADEHRLLDELSLAFGLVKALDDAVRQGKAPTALVGRARSRYDESAALELLGLGAMSWRSGSGYIGLTMMFWSPAEQSFFSCTDARPENQRGFDPIARYKAAGPWSGLGAPAQATGHKVTLTGAQINVAGRLSAASSVAATVQPLARGELASLLQPCRLWADLRQSRQVLRRSLLAEPQPMKDWVLLGPGRTGAAKFDATRQTLVWPVFDYAGEPLPVELTYSEHNRHAISRLEQLAAEGLPADSLIVVRVRGGSTGLVAEPLSLIYTDGRDHPVDAIYFDPPGKQGFASKLLAKLRMLPASSGAPAQQALRASNTPTELHDMRRWLQRQAERGVTDEAVMQATQEFCALSNRASTSGLTAFTKVSISSRRLPSRLLEAHYLCLQYERLFDNGEDQVE